MSSDVYTHGHEPSVLRSHSWRTAENSAAYLLPHLRPGMDLLDVGCGPGTITVDLAARVSPGRVVAIDAAPEIVETAEQEASRRGATNVTVGVGDVYSLDFEDGSFDVVHAHQVLQHLSDPVAALRQMGRVARAGGVVAARDADYSAMFWSPTNPDLDRWMAIYQEVTERNRAEADAGRHLLGWARAAGFDDVTVSTSTWTFADPEGRKWWGELWADRIVSSSLAVQAVDYGIATAEELAEVASGWRRWLAEPDGFFVVVHGEVLVRVDRSRARIGPGSTAAGPGGLS